MSCWVVRRLQFPACIGPYWPRITLEGWGCATWNAVASVTRVWGGGWRYAVPCSPHPMTHYWQQLGEERGLVKCHFSPTALFKPFYCNPCSRNEYNTGINHMIGPPKAGNSASMIKLGELVFLLSAHPQEILVNTQGIGGSNRGIVCVTFRWHNFVQAATGLVCQTRIRTILSSNPQLCHEAHWVIFGHSLFT